MRLTYPQIHTIHKERKKVAKKERKAAATFSFKNRTF